MREELGVEIRELKKQVLQVQLQSFRIMQQSMQSLYKPAPPATPGPVVSQDQGPQNQGSQSQDVQGQALTPQAAPENVIVPEKNEASQQNPDLQEAKPNASVSLQAQYLAALQAVQVARQSVDNAMQAARQSIKEAEDILKVRVESAEKNKA
jgi:hypothetical protein